MRKSDAYFVLRDGAAGVFLAAKLSRNRVKRVRHWWKSFIASGPSAGKTALSGRCATAGSGRNKTMVRFSRKTKQQYVSSEKTERRLAGQHFMLMANGLKEKITFNSVRFL